MYLESVRGLISKLLVEEGGLSYVAEMKNGRLERKMDHLVCFVSGTLALGAQHIPEGNTSESESVQPSSRKRRRVGDENDA